MDSCWESRQQGFGRGNDVVYSGTRSRRELRNRRRTRRQGDGEVDVTALETSLIGTFQFVVRKDMHLRWPRAETPTHYITMGLNDDLNACATLAVREMIDFKIGRAHV